MQCPRCGVPIKVNSKRKLGVCRECMYTLMIKSGKLSTDNVMQRGSKRMKYTMDNRLKVFGVVNHVGNQHEMLKLAKKYPIKFCYLENNVRRWTRFSARPEPSTVYTKDEFEWVTHYEPGKYDLAILHVDQQHADPMIGKGQLYRAMNKVIQDIPKMVINHGTPMWDEAFTEDLVINGGEILTSKGTRRIEGMKELVGDNFMVVNSYDSVARWGWGYPLIHGMDKDDWLDLPKEPRVVISLSPGGLDKYYNRALLTAIKAQVKDKTGMDVQHIMVNFESRDFLDYREFLGSSLIYINPTFDSPMPRSRTEAMLSGCCVLTSKYHNADEFIEHGVNGFIVPDNPMSYAKGIQEILNGGYRNAIEIGRKGKHSAQKLFNLERYLDDLFYLITEVTEGRKPEWDGSKIWEDVREAKK
ncbi:Glycosyl transferase, family 1 [uncultured Caudovirales phage]|uniref:Glycosyl transferase, family 1 n=1 Tax=uncultured Caudovirales phage TaxID=2100421 RepID=A0A6J5N2R2_9CAUD|nr:Glycosyl transferase, family 1 [uncultured Caudovirales phage]